MSRILIGNILWKSVENSGALGRKRAGKRPLQPAFCAVSGASHQALRACSACAGDYEDPDRTAWTPDPQEDEELPQERAQEQAENQGDHGDEFPAQRE
mgnify:CR=1 FL=1